MYRFVDKNTLFDYIEPEAKGEYPLHLRVVRVKIKKGVYENLITILPKEEFDLAELRILYYLRRNILYELSCKESKPLFENSNMQQEPPISIANLPNM